MVNFHFNIYFDSYPILYHILEEICLFLVAFCFHFFYREQALIALSFFSVFHKRFTTEILNYKDVRQ